MIEHTAFCHAFDPHEQLSLGSGVIGNTSVSETEESGIVPQLPNQK